MGDRAQREKPPKPKPEEEVTKKKKKKKISLVDKKKRIKLRVDPRESLLTTNLEETNIYRPKTKENRIYYENILQIVAK